VWAEVAGSFASAAAAQNALELLHLEFSALSVEASLAAGIAWKAYQARGGLKTRVAADFLIGAHAYSQADRLLTRDRGFYRSCFKRLVVLDPTRAHHGS
jgi:predicted nucleic acid-binding protein